VPDQVSPIPHTALCTCARSALSLMRLRRRYEAYPPENCMHSWKLHLHPVHPAATLIVIKPPLRVPRHVHYTGSAHTNAIRLCMSITHREREGERARAGERRETHFVFEKA